MSSTSRLATEVHSPSTSFCSPFANCSVVGVGAQSNSCGKCEDCKNGEQNHCVNTTNTYGDKYKDGSGKSYGGYATYARHPGNFVFNIPEGLDSAEAAPMLCGGVTVYSPLKNYGCGPGKKVRLEDQRMSQTNSNISRRSVLLVSVVSVTSVSSSPRHLELTRSSVSLVRLPRKTKSSSSVPTDTSLPMTTRIGQRTTVALST
jgi:hypothetical protein